MYESPNYYDIKYQFLKLLYLIKVFNIITPIIPTTETIVSITDQDLNVSFIDRLKYSLNIQKPGSLTCENIKLPAPIDNTIRFGFTPVLIISGAMIPAVVRPAIVAEPTETRIKAAINQPKSKG